MNTLAPVVLFAYNRPRHLHDTIEALKNNTLAKNTRLIVYVDGPKLGQENKVQEVINYCRNISGFQSIDLRIREVNFGLGKSIIEGVTNVINEFGKVIVLEDDLVTSPYFLEFSNTALDLYEKEIKVMSIVGYNYPIKINADTYFLNNADCLGWSTWKDRWHQFEPDAIKLRDEILYRKLKRRFNMDGSYPFYKLLEKVIDGKNTSWAIRWYATVFLKDALTLYPGKSLVKHIGNDEGTNMNGSNFLDTELYPHPIQINQIPFTENLEARKQLAKYFRINGRLFGLIWNKLIFQIQNKLKNRG